MCPPFPSFTVVHVPHDTRSIHRPTCMSGRVAKTDGQPERQRTTQTSRLLTCCALPHWHAQNSGRPNKEVACAAHGVSFRSPCRDAPTFAPLRYSNFPPKKLAHTSRASPARVARRPDRISLPAAATAGRKKNAARVRPRW